MLCEFLKMLFLEHEINLELVNIFVQNLKNGLIKLAKGAPMPPPMQWHSPNWTKTNKSKHESQNAGETQLRD